MPRFAKYCLIGLIAMSSALAIAGGFDYAKEDVSGYTLQPNLRVTDDSEFGRTGNSIYFYSGYLYANYFLNNAQQTVTDGNGNSYVFSPKTVFPSNFSGFEVGVGKEMTKYVELQFAYLQQLIEHKNTLYQGNAYDISSKSNGLLADVGIVLNPDDQFQVIARVGAMVSEYYIKPNINSTSIPNLTTDQTRIEPAGGLDLLFMFTRHVGFRVGAMYIADIHNNTQNNISNGQLNVLAALSYTL